MSRHRRHLHVGSDRARRRRRLLSASGIRGSLRTRSGLAAVGGGAVVVVVAAAASAYAPSGSLPRAVSVGGVPVGGLTLSDARRRLEDAADARLRRSLVLLARGRRFELSGALLGLRPRIDLALRDAGKSRGPLSRLGARLRVVGEVKVPLRFSATEATEAAIASLDKALARPARSARVRVTATSLAVVPAERGHVVAADQLRLALARLPSSLTVPFRPSAPRIPTPAAIRAQARAIRLLRDPPLLALGSRRLALESSILRRSLRFEPRGRELVVRVDPVALVPVLRAAFGQFERPTVDARFLADGRVARLQPSRSGRRIASGQTAEAILDRRGDAPVRVRVETVPPRITTAAARRLGIRELVSTFSTSYACCEPRVTNIRRAAALLDDTLILPDATFSLNRSLGPRTPARGFVPAPMIDNGRLVDSVGGGVSQVATTIFNAAFFAGLELLEHTPHQFYIARYPMGREATVSWGGPELEFRNDWPAAILAKVDAGATTITVRFYSSRLGRHVETTTSEPFGVRPVPRRTVVERSLKPGNRRVVEAGARGFSVRYTRRVHRRGRLVRNESFLVSYAAKEAVVAVGPKRRDTAPVIAGSRRNRVPRARLE